jgi:RHS repeat-associated protein
MMKKLLSLILILAFSVTYIGSSFATEPAPEPSEEPSVTTQAIPGPPTSPDSPPATHMNSAGLSGFQSFSNKVIDDRVDPISGSLVINQTDLVIPGRNGLDLVISRSYNSRRFSTPPQWLTPSQKQRIDLINDGHNPKTVVDIEGDGPKSDAWGGWMCKGWVINIGGRLRAITYSGADKFQFPSSQIVVEYGGSVGRFTENSERTGIYFSQEKGSFDIVKKTDFGYVLIDKTGVKHYFEVCSYDGYYGFDPGSWVHEKSYLLTKIESLNGNSLLFKNEIFAKDFGDERKKRHVDRKDAGPEAVRIPKYSQFTVLATIPLEGASAAAVAGEMIGAVGALLSSPWFWAVVVIDVLVQLFNQEEYVYHEVVGYKAHPYRPTEITDSCGRKLSISYTNDDKCQINRISYLDQNGTEVSYNYVYNDNDNLIEVIPPQGNSTKYDYVYKTEDLGDEFDDKGYLLSQIIYPTGATVNYSYSWYNPKDDASASAADIEEKDVKNYSFYTVNSRDVSGIGASAYEHSGGSLFNSTKDNAVAGVVWGFEKVRVRDPLGREFEQMLKGGIVSQSENPMGYTTSYDWDLNHYHLRDVEIKRNSNIIKTKYRQFDGFGNFHVQTEGGDSATLSDDRTAHFEFEYEKNPVYKDNNLTGLVSHQWIERNGKFGEVYFEYDTEGKGNLLRKVEKTDGADIITQYQYDSYGNLVKQIDPNGAVTNFEYGPEYKGAYLTRISKTVGGQALVATKIYYFNTGLLKGEADFNGNATSYEYDKIGRMTQKTNPDSTYLRYSYNDSSNEISVTNENGQTTTYKYDSLGRLSDVTFPDGKTASYQYNAVSKITAVVDRAGRRTSYSYDDLDRITDINYPDGSRVEYEYDDSRNVTTVSDSLGNTNKYKYSNFGNLTDVTQADGERAMYEYDTIDNLAKVTDPRFLSTKYIYDSRGQLLRSEYADGTSYQFDYDPNGNPVKKIDAKGQRITYAYDELGRVTKSEYPDPSFDVARYYDEGSGGRGMLTMVKDPSGITRYNYDSRGRIIEATKTMGGTTFSTKYTYDGVGNLLALEDPTGNLKTYYEYDDLNRVTEVRRDRAAGGQVLVAGYSYNPSNTINTVSFYNGNLVKYTYDLMGRVDKLTILDKGGNEIVKYDYDYDAAGNLTKHLISPSDSFAYEYDKVYRLTRVDFPSEDDSEYTYDPAGNRDSLKYAYGDIEYFYEPKSNQMDYYIVNAHGKVDYSHDENGNLVKEVKFEAGNEVHSADYIYDPEDRLIKISLTQPKIDNLDMPDLAPKTVEMVYDANGMRVKKMANGETTLYHYDLANNVLSETDENGQVRETFIYANGMRVASVSPDGKMKFFHNDPLGSPIMITDENGNALQRYVYDPYGTVIVSKGENENNHTYTGKELDAESGLMYYGARFYDPKIGRFITKDIAAPDYGNAQSLNRYVYCLNNPLKFVDPDGRKVELAYRHFFGWFRAVHSYYVITPDNPQLFKEFLFPGKNYFVLSANKENLMLIKELNSVFDAEDFDSKAFFGIHEILPEKGVSDTAFIREFIKLFEAYPKIGLTYVPWGLNCNAFTRGLGQGAGAANLPEHLVGRDWGWDFPIDFKGFLDPNYNFPLNSNLGYSDFKGFF